MLAAGCTLSYGMGDSSGVANGKGEVVMHAMIISALTTFLPSMTGIALNEGDANRLCQDMFSAYQVGFLCAKPEVNKPSLELALTSPHFELLAPAIWMRSERVGKLARVRAKALYVVVRFHFTRSKRTMRETLFNLGNLSCSVIR